MTEAASAPRPPWLHPTMHMLNAAAAWGDLAVAARRSFSCRSERLSAALVAAYLCFIQLCCHMNGCACVRVCVCVCVCVFECA